MFRQTHQSWSIPLLEALKCSASSIQRPLQVKRSLFRIGIKLQIILWLLQLKGSLVLGQIPMQGLPEVHTMGGAETCSVWVCPHLPVGHDTRVVTLLVLVHFGVAQEHEGDVSPVRPDHASTRDGLRKVGVYGRPTDRLQPLKLPRRGNVKSLWRKWGWGGRGVGWERVGSGRGVGLRKMEGYEERSTV